MIDPSACDRRDQQQDCDDERMAAAGDGNDHREHYQRKQERWNQISAFDFLDKRSTGEADAKTNE